MGYIYASTTMSFILSSTNVEFRCWKRGEEKKRNLGKNKKWNIYLRWLLDKKKMIEKLGYNMCLGTIHVIFYLSEWGGYFNTKINIIKLDKEHKIKVKLKINLDSI